MVSREEVLRMAELARLTLDPQEADRLTEDLRGILRHVDMLSEVDISDVPPFDAGGAETPVRPDVPGADPLAHEPGTLAPDWRDGFFTVPRLPSHGGAGEET